MKEKVSINKKVLGISACLVPIIAVSAVLNFQKSGLFDAFTVTDEPTASITVTDKENLAPASLVEKETDTAPSVFSSVSSDIDVIKNVGSDDKVTLGEIETRTVDCVVPKVQRDKYSKLVAKIVEASDEASTQRFELGKVLQASKGQDCQALAFDFFRRAAASGNGRAYSKIANAYQKGLGIEQSFRKAVDYYKMSAQLGYANSAYLLIELIQRGGQGFPADNKAASRYFEELLPLLEEKVRRGDEIAARSLARLDGNPHLEQRDIEKSGDFYRFAAKRGDEIAMHDLALILVKHKRAELKKSDVFPLLLRSSELGYSAAYTALGRLYLKGEFEVRREEAPIWFRKGVEAGHPGAMEELATLYFDGDIVERDLVFAKELATQGARLKHRGSMQLLQAILDFENTENDAG